MLNLYRSIYLDMIVIIGTVRPKHPKHYCLSVRSHETDKVASSAYGYLGCPESIIPTHKSRSWPKIIPQKK